MAGHPKRHERSRLGVAAALILVACSAEGPDSAQAEQPPSFTAGRLPVDPNADIDSCEIAIRSALDEPSTYVRRSATRRDMPIGVETYLELIGEVGTYESIRDTIAADAAEFGLQLRELTIESASRVGGRERVRTDVCRFELYGGRLPDQAELTRRLEAVRSRAETLKILARRGEPGTAEAAQQVSCCLLD